MKFIRSLARRFGRSSGPEDVTLTGALIGNLLDKATYEVFAPNKSLLLRKPITYVVPAVWGVSGSSPLDSVQREMNQKIAPVVDEVMESLQLAGLNPAQEFALQYLIRGYMVSKIAFMIESFKGHSSMPGRGGRPEIADLASLEPVGRA
jgi:hypothetical protein